MSSKKNRLKNLKNTTLKNKFIKGGSYPSAIQEEEFNRLHGHQFRVPGCEGSYGVYNHMRGIGMQHELALNHMYGMCQNGGFQGYLSNMGGITNPTEFNNYMMRQPGMGIGMRIGANGFMEPGMGGMGMMGPEVSQLIQQLQMLIQQINTRLMQSGMMGMGGLGGLGMGGVSGMGI